MEALHHTSGSLVWVWASVEQGWVKGTVQKVEKNGQLLVQLEDGKTGKFKPEDCPLANPLSRMGVEVRELGRQGIEKAWKRPLSFDSAMHIVQEVGLG